MLLHGFLASSHYFSKLRKNLSVTHTVVAIDLLGFGLSPKPSVIHSYDVHVEAIKNTLDHLNVHAPFTLLGHSMGALIAARYALRYPANVAALQLFNPPMFVSNYEATQAFQATGIHYRAILYSRVRRLLWSGLKALPRRHSTKRSPINFTDSVRASYNARESSYQTIILATEFLDDITKIHIPTLLVTGRHDRPMYQKNIHDIQLPNTISYHLVDTGHHTPVKAPGLTESLIRSHLLQ